MTVPVPDQLEYISDADGVTKDFPYPKRFLQKDEIVVLLRDADGVDTPQILNTHYTIAGSSWPSGGTISFITAPQAPNKVVRYRMTQAKQTVDLENNQRNDAPSVELQLDRLTMAIQDRGDVLSDLFLRSVKVPFGYSGSTVLPWPDPNKLLGWNENGDGFANKEILTAGDLVVGAAGKEVIGKDTVEGIRDFLNIKDPVEKLFDTASLVETVEIDSEVNSIRTAGFSTAGDGGAALYKRVAAEPSHIGKIQSADGAWWEIADRVLRPEMFGGKSEAGFDNKVALEGGIKFAFSIGGEFRIDKNYETTDIVIDAGQGTVAGTGWLISHANSNQDDVYESQLVTFTSGVNYSDISLRIDLSNQSKSGMAVKGDENKIDCICKNAVMTVGRTRHIWALRVSGDLVGGKGNKNHVRFVLAWNMVSPAADGAVAANALVVDGYARDTNVDYIWATEGLAALINNGRRTTVDFIYCKDCIDNVVYDIEGAENLKIGTVFAVNATDEVICLRSDANPYIGKVIMYECAVGVGVSDSASPAIGEIFWQNYGTVASGAPLYVRPTQTGITNRINVDKLTIRGTWKNGAPILSFTNGGVREVRIGEITADIYYSDATAIKALAFWQGCEELHIGSVDIQASDTTGTLTEAAGLTLNLPSTLTRSSFIGRMNLSARGAFSVRANNIGTFLTIGGVPFIRGDLGNVIANQDGAANAVRIFQSGLAPSAGTWRRGDIVYNTAPSGSGFIGWVCTASGTPGTWKTFGAFST